MYVNGLIERAKSGNIDAQYEVSRLYLVGDVIEKDIEIAINWLNLAANNGHPKANLDLGIIYYKKQDHKKAKVCLEFAANEGIAEAQYLMAKICAIYGEFENSIKWGYLAARQDHCESKYDLGCRIIEIRGINVHNNAHKELSRKIPEGDEYKWIESAADQGNIDAMCFIGRRYVLQIHPPFAEEKVAKGIEFLKKASLDGRAEAKLTLATYCEYIVGGSVGKKTAEGLYREVIKQRHPSPTMSCYNAASEGLERVMPGYKKWIFGTSRRIY